MEFAKTTFTCGRYANKTYEEIAKTDEAFCKQVLKSKVNHKYHPASFKQYLIAIREVKIEFDASYVGAFIDQLSKAMRVELQGIAGNEGARWREVHQPSKMVGSGLMGLFYRYFFRKCVHNVKGEKATVRGRIEDYCRIFPFKVRTKVPKVKLPVMELFDADFNREIGDFVELHFEKSTFGDLLDLFFGNVYSCRMTYFKSPEAVDQLNSFVRPMVLKNARSLAAKPKNVLLLEKYPRLNKRGVQRYQAFENEFMAVCRLYDERVRYAKKPREYFEYLPEVNFYELFSLLETDLYNDDRKRYLQLLEKYLFFFGHAVECEDHPVFCVDDVLYECAKFVPIFCNSSDEVLSLEYTVWMMTLVHRRTHTWLEHTSTQALQPDAENLKQLQAYVASIPGIETASVNYREPDALLDICLFMLVEDRAYEICYSANKKTSKLYLETVTNAAFLSKIVKKVVIFNAYKGTETVLTVPSKKSEVVDFVGKYSKPKPFRPEDIVFFSLEENFKNIH